MQRIFGLIALGSLALQPSAIAQIPSTLPAAGSSGSSASGASSTSVASPNFSQGFTPLVDGVELDSKGNIIATNEQTEAVDEALRSTSSQPEVQILSPVLETSSSFPSVEVASTNLNQPLIPSPGSVSPTASTATDQRLASISALTSQLVASGLQPSKASKLLTLMGSLSRQTNLNNLSAAITLFNQVIRQSSPTELNSLRGNPVFVAISIQLRAARTALGTRN
jgi:hypothetical protein